jgi:hypothetical protein
MIGERLSPILLEIENTLLESFGVKPNFNKEGFRAAVFIFQSVLMDAMFALQESENMGLEEREKMAETCGVEIRKLVKNFTNIDTHDLY